MPQYKVRYKENPDSAPKIVSVTAPDMAAIENHFGEEKLISVTVPQTKIYIQSDDRE
jgi:hypothetical protein